MGRGYDFKCSTCDYHITVMVGVGMMHSPNAVFYGRCDDPTQNWSVTFPDGYCRDGKPLLSNLVKSKKIKEKAFKLLADGAIPDDKYGFELYLCPKCLNLSNGYYFKLHYENEDYEPDYKCAHCKVSLVRVKVRIENDGTVGIVHRNHRKAKYKCPECGGDMLINEGIIMWD